MFKTLCYSRSGWYVWADLITAIACSLSNVIDKSEKHFNAREKEYAECIKRLGGVEMVAQLFNIIVEALDADQEQDFLGELFMSLGFGNEWKGQFFTPYHVADVMAKMTLGSADEQIKQQGYISISDPACGAGVTLIAASNVIRKQREDHQNHVLFVGQDVDKMAGLMCYVQISLLGLAGYVCIASTLSNPLTGHPLFPQEKDGQQLWFTPMFGSDIWHYRRNFHMLDRLMKSKPPQAPKKNGFTFFFDFNNKEVENDGKTEITVGT